MDNTAKVKAHIDFQRPPQKASAAPLASGATQGAAQAALGNTAKSSDNSGRKVTTQERRAERYDALSMARHWLTGFAKKRDPSALPGDIFRTTDCRWTRRDRFVGVNFSAAHQACHYSALATCGSVWACPVCCALIQQRRRTELAQLIDWAYSEGFAPIMVTLTFPHKSFDRLQDLIEQQRLALTTLRKTAKWKKLCKANGYGGLVRSLEVTHGANGWHPHTHEIWLVRGMSPERQADFKMELSEMWRQACEKSGLLDCSDRQKAWSFARHAVDVRFGVSQSDYLAKQDSSRAWGADREVATASSKAGRSKGVHPHEFLIRRSKGDAVRFMEYVDGMKGARQLFWSPGLKDKVGIVDLSNEQIADESREAAELLGRLNPDQWDLIRRKGARAVLLDAAESQGWEGVLSLLGSLGWDWRG